MSKIRFGVDLEKTEYEKLCVMSEEEIIKGLKATYSQFRNRTDELVEKQVQKFLLRNKIKNRNQYGSVLSEAELETFKELKNVKVPDSMGNALDMVLSTYKIEKEANKTIEKAEKVRKFFSQQGEKNDVNVDPEFKALQKEIKEEEKKQKHSEEKKNESEIQVGNHNFRAIFNKNKKQPVNAPVPAQKKDEDSALEEDEEYHFEPQDRYDVQKMVIAGIAKEIKKTLSTEKLSSFESRIDEINKLSQNLDSTAANADVQLEKFENGLNSFKDALNVEVSDSKERLKILDAESKKLSDIVADYAKSSTKDEWHYVDVSEQRSIVTGSSKENIYQGNDTFQDKFRKAAKKLKFRKTNKNQEQPEKEEVKKEEPKKEEVKKEEPKEPEKKEEKKTEAVENKLPEAEHEKEPVVEQKAAVEDPKEKAKIDNTIVQTNEVQINHAREKKQPAAEVSKAEKVADIEINAAVEAPKEKAENVIRQVAKVEINPAEKKNVAEDQKEKEKVDNTIDKTTDVQIKSAEQKPAEKEPTAAVESEKQKQAFEKYEGSLKKLTDENNVVFSDNLMRSKTEISELDQDVLQDKFNKNQQAENELRSLLPEKLGKIDERNISVPGLIKTQMLLEEGRLSPEQKLDHYKNILAIKDMDGDKYGKQLLDYRLKVAEEAGREFDQKHQDPSKLSFLNKSANAIETVMCAMSRNPLGIGVLLVAAFNAPMLIVGLLAFTAWKRKRPDPAYQQAWREQNQRELETKRQQMARLYGCDPRDLSDREVTKALKADYVHGKVLNALDEKLERDSRKEVEKITKDYAKAISNGSKDKFKAKDVKELARKSTGQAKSGKDLLDRMRSARENRLENRARKLDRGGLGF